MTREEDLRIWKEIICKVWIEQQEESGWFVYYSCQLTHSIWHKRMPRRNNTKVDLTRWFVATFWMKNNLRQHEEEENIRSWRIRQQVMHRRKAKLKITTSTSSKTKHFVPYRNSLFWLNISRQNYIKAIKFSGQKRVPSRQFQHLRACSAKVHIIYTSHCKCFKRIQVVSVKEMVQDFRFMLHLLRVSLVG